MSHRGREDEEFAETPLPKGEEASFVSRWSRRKRAAEDAGHGAAVEQGTTRPPTGPSPTPGVPELTDADMPAVETLGEDSEFQGFMSPGVSEELRKLALRKLFHLPGFNVRDGLDDYDEDFTRFAALGDVMTQDLRHRLKTAERRENERTEEDVASLEPPADAADDPADDPLVQSEVGEEQDSAEPGPVAVDDGAADTVDRERS